jgi:hypothetical protein
MLPNCQPAGELVSIPDEVVPTQIPSAHRISGVREDRESNRHIDFRLKLGILESVPVFVGGRFEASFIGPKKFCCQGK